MIKNITQLSHKIGDRAFHILCDQDSPLNEVKDALFEFLKYIGKIEDAAKAAQQSQNEDVKDEGKEQAEAQNFEAPQE